MKYRFQKGHKINLGRKRLDVTIKNLENPNIRKTQFKKGNNVWNEGLTKETDDRIKKQSEKQSETKKRLFIEGKLMGFKKGHKAWNIGLTNETDERMKSISINRGLTLKRLFAEGKLISNKKIIFSEEQKNEIKRLYEEELSSPTKIGKIFNCSSSKILHTLKELNANKTGGERVSLLFKANKLIHPLKNKHHSELTRLKQKEARLKNPVKYWEDKTLSNEHRVKISAGKQNVPLNEWKQFISFEPYGVEFNDKLKKEIRIRDNHTCQQCGFTQEQLGYKLPIHHIDFNKKNNHPNNLISLCKSCHAQTQFNRQDWTNYFQNKINNIQINKQI